MGVIDTRKGGPTPGFTGEVGEIGDDINISLDPNHRPSIIELSGWLNSIMRVWALSGSVSEDKTDEENLEEYIRRQKVIYKGALKIVKESSFMTPPIYSAIPHTMYPLLQVPFEVDASVSTAYVSLIKEPSELTLKSNTLNRYSKEAVLRFSPGMAVAMLFFSNPRAFFNGDVLGNYFSDEELVNRIYSFLEPLKSARLNDYANEEIAAVIIHELQHILFEHTHVIYDEELKEFAENNKAAFNVIYDFYINTIISMLPLYRSKLGYWSDSASFVDRLAGLGEEVPFFLDAIFTMRSSKDNAQMISERLFKALLATFVGKAFDVLSELATPENALEYYLFFDKNILKYNLQEKSDKELIEFYISRYSDAINWFGKNINAAFDVAKFLPDYIENKISPSKKQELESYIDKLDDKNKEIIEKLKNSKPSSDIEKKARNFLILELVRVLFNYIYSEKISEDYLNIMDNDEELLKKINEYIMTFGPIRPNDAFSGAMDKEGSSKVQGSLREAEARQSREKINEIIEEVRESSSSMGYAPGFLRKIKVDRRKYVPPFISLLMHFTDTVGVGGYHPTYSPPNKKRRNSSGFVLPTRVEKFAKVGIVIDTSGSMSDSEINKMLIAIQGMASVFPEGEFIVGFNDAEHYEFTRFNGASIYRLIDKIRKDGVAGGGGSVFVSVFKDSVMRDIDMLIFFSDFYIVIPDTPVQKPTILIPTKDPNSSTLNDAKKIFTPSVVIPLDDVRA